MPAGRYGAVDRADPALARRLVEAREMRKGTSQRNAGRGPYILTCAISMVSMAILKGVVEYRRSDRSRVRSYAIVVGEVLGSVRLLDADRLGDC